MTQVIDNFSSSLNPHFLPSPILIINRGKKEKEGKIRTFERTVGEIDEEKIRTVKETVGEINEEIEKNSKSYYQRKEEIKSRNSTESKDKSKDNIVFSEENNQIKPLSYSPELLRQIGEKSSYVIKNPITDYSYLLK